jgi:hypothetical protein
MEQGDIPIVGHQTPTENEQRALGGFFAESTFTPDDFDLVQVEVPIGLQRVASAFDELIQSEDRSLTEILTPHRHTDNPRGFPMEKELSNRYGFRMVSYTSKIDVVIVTTETIYITEIKTRNQQIEGLHDLYEGLGQILMNRDRFHEDYPSVAGARPVKGLLLAENSGVDVTLFKDSLIERKVGFFDPRRDGFLINP